MASREDDNVKCNLNQGNTLDGLTKTQIKPCCACPDTRKLRDDCVFLKGEEGCQEYIEKHNECLRSYGFKV